MAAGKHFPARGTLPASIFRFTGSFTVEGLREGQSKRFFSDARKPAKQVGVPDATLGDGPLQHADLSMMAVNTRKRHNDINPRG